MYIYRMGAHGDWPLIDEGEACGLAMLGSKKAQLLKLVSSVSWRYHPSCRMSTRLDAFYSYRLPAGEMKVR